MIILYVYILYISYTKEMVYVSDGRRGKAEHLREISHISNLITSGIKEYFQNMLSILFVVLLREGHLKCFIKCSDEVRRGGKAGLIV